MKIKQMPYEECREDFFVNLIKHAENKIKYWKRQKGYRCEIDENLAEAGAEISYCRDALNALEKQIPKKCTDGFHKEKFIDGRCPTCSFRQSKGDIEWKRQFNKYCRNCGQALDWSDSE